MTLWNLQEATLLQWQSPPLECAHCHDLESSIILEKTLFAEVYIYLHMAVYIYMWVYIYINMHICIWKALPWLVQMWENQAQDPPTAPACTQLHRPLFLYILSRRRNDVQWDSTEACVAFLVSIMHFLRYFVGVLRWSSHLGFRPAVGFGFRAC